MKVIDNWEEATQKLAIHFVHTYFEEPEYLVDWWWVADNIGDVLFVNDYWFQLERIVEAIISDATFEQLTDYYEYEYEHSQSDNCGIPPPINFKNYLKGAR